MKSKRSTLLAVAVSPISSMRTLGLALLLLGGTIFAATAMAADMHGGHGMTHTPVAEKAAETPMVDGLVKKVDKPAGKVTLAHEALHHLGMSMPMTMVFRVKDAAWLDQLKEGDKIRFAAEKINGAFTVMGFEPVK